MKRATQYGTGDIVGGIISIHALMKRATLMMELLR